jgi:hypothetical protein
MANADISALGNLNPVEPLDMDQYQDNQEFPPLPQKGRYTVRAPEKFLFSRTQTGSLSAQVDPTVVGPTNENYTVRFTKCSGKTWKRNGVTVSQIGDYLRACGVKGKITNEQDQIDLVEQTANSIYQIDGDWRAYHKDGFKLEGMEKFPSDNNGGHQEWCEHPTEKDEQGNPVRLPARFYVRRFVPMGE